MDPRDRDFQRRLRGFGDIWRRVGRPGPIGPPPPPPFGGPPPPPPPFPPPPPRPGHGPGQRPCRRRRPPGWR